MLSLLLFISIQLLSESFPVSSSGHVALALRIFFSEKSVFSSSLSAVLHAPELILWSTVPTMCVVALFFMKEWWFLLRHFSGTWRMVGKLIGYMLCSNTITALFYFFMHTYNLPIPLWVGFGVTGAMLFSLRMCVSNTHESLTAKRAVLLGIVQGVALLPGVSRFASVFVASRWMGIDARRSFNISWMLQWPLAAGISLLSVYQYMKHPTHWVLLDLTTFMIIGGVSIAAFVGLYGMYWLSQRGMLWIMSLYMILPLIASFFCWR